eukprot:sb/3475967/
MGDIRGRRGEKNEKIKYNIFFCFYARFMNRPKQPIRTRYLGHVTGYQPIRGQYFLNSISSSCPLCIVDSTTFPWGHHADQHRGSGTTQLGSSGCHTLPCHHRTPEILLGSGLFVYDRDGWW